VDHLSGRELPTVVADARRLAGLPPMGVVQLGLGRIVALYDHSPTSHQIH
jgi:hypothetical protein